MMFADENGGLAVADPVAIELGCLDADEDLVAEDLDLRHLMQVHRILDGERVKTKILLSLGQFGGIRLMQPDPDELARMFRRAGIGEVHCALALAVLVKIGCDDGHQGADGVP